jgi:filamentous hemagglutinin
MESQGASEAFQTKNKAQTPRVKKQLTHEELAARASSLDKAPYDPRTVESMLKVNNPNAKVTSTTLPKVTDKNVQLAGTRHGETGIVFDSRGCPVFDKYVKHEVRITGDLKNIDKKAHMRAATRQLKAEIEAGIVDKNMFTAEQLHDIKSGSYKIEGFTWHHHQDFGRMQLIPEEIHSKTGHVGGFEMWGGKK